MDINATQQTRAPGGRFERRGSLELDSPLVKPAPTDAERRERDRADARGVPYIVMRDELKLQRIVPLEARRLFLGRDEQAQLSIPWDLGVSRLHAALERTPDGRWWVVDEGRSTNGTFVNRVRVQDRVQLSDGDTVQVGETALAFRVPQGPP